MARLRVRLAMLLAGRARVDRRARAARALRDDPVDAARLDAPPAALEALEQLLLGWPAARERGRRRRADGPAHRGARGGRAAAARVCASIRCVGRGLAHRRLDADS